MTRQQTWLATGGIRARGQWVEWRQRKSTRENRKRRRRRRRAQKKKKTKKKERKKRRTKSLLWRTRARKSALLSRAQSPDCPRTLCVVFLCTLCSVLVLVLVLVVVIGILVLFVSCSSCAFFVLFSVCFCPFLVSVLLFVLFLSLCSLLFLVLSCPFLLCSASFPVCPPCSLSRSCSSASSFFFHLVCTGPCLFSCSVGQPLLHRDGVPGRGREL